MQASSDRSEFDLAPHRCYLFLSTDKERELLPSPRSLTAVMFALYPAVIYFACLINGTLEIDGGKGLSHHYGYWVIFITTPLIVMLSGYLLDKFVDLVGSYKKYINPDANQADLEKLRRIIADEVKSLCLQSRLRYLLYFGVLVGFFYFEINAVETYDPYPTYGHDVFDSWSHPLSCWLAKLYLLPIFIWLYPVAIFLALHVTLSMVKILKFSCDQDLLAVSFFHQDNCGGMSPFGYINFLIMVIYILFLSVLCGMFLTHQRTYFVMISALTFCSVVPMIQSFLAVGAIYAMVKKKKLLLLDELGALLDQSLRDVIEGKEGFRSELVTLRKQVISTHAFPYGRNVHLIVSAIRFAPVLLTLGSILKSLVYPHLVSS